jgi:murein DD-endopeptidase MepM/ murein hydrolase activator NlpD
MDKRQVVVYELNVTNFDLVPVRLKRLEVFADEAGGAPLSALGGDALAKAMTRIGSGSGGSMDTAVIEPGGRSVVFAWIEVDPARRLPASLRHELTFSPESGDVKADQTIKDFDVPVRRGSVPTLSPPFKDGIWLAGNGPANDSAHRRTLIAIDGRVFSPERFAIDWDKIGPNGDTHHDGTTRNENWWGYGEPVLAVADGEITALQDGIPDNAPRSLPPVTLDNIAGNYVVLRISPTRYVTYAHLQNGSVRVRLGERVRRGATLGLLGNSGQTTGAHLHLQVTDRNSVLESDGVPFVIARFMYLGPGAEYETDKHISIPWVDSIPPGNAVVMF